MIWFFIIAVAFQAVFDNWGDNSTVSNVIYFAFQYGWMAMFALYLYRKEESLLYLLIAFYFTALSVNELTWLGTDINALKMMQSGPANFGFGFLAVLLFLYYLTYKNIKLWKE